MERVYNHVKSDQALWYIPPEPAARRKGYHRRIKMNTRAVAGGKVHPSAGGRVGTRGNLRF
jgi:hypothetical protein